MKKDFMNDTLIRDQHIPNNWIKKWQSEVAVWKEMLTARMEENVSIKNTISDILKDYDNQICLDEIEEFQTASIREDEITMILRNEVVELDNILSNNNLEAIESQKTVRETIKLLRTDMIYSEKRFSSLISSFTDFQQKICRGKEI